MNLGDNWFDYSKYYDEVAEKLTDKSTFIEVGTWLGRSIIHLAQKCKELNKRPKLYCVDVWSDCVKEEAQLNFIKYLGGPSQLFKTFLDNCNEFGVGELIWPIRASSLCASTFFNDNSVDEIFIDAGHTESEVIADIDAWYRVVKKGGRIAGHDFDSQPVIQAVRKSFKKDKIVEKPGHVWSYIKE